MSVWSNPCYAIEPIRNIANNLPFGNSSRIPPYLESVTSFHFQECKGNHPERSGKSAWEYYSEDHKRWSKFYFEAPRHLSQVEGHQFASTLEETNLSFAGLKAVYWAFEKFRTKEWEAKAKLEVKDLIEFAGTTFKLGCEASRVNKEVYQTAKSYFEEEAEEGWAQLESATDAVRFMWTLKTSQRVRKITKRNVALVQKVFKSKLQKIKVSSSVEDTVPPPRVFPTKKALESVTKKEVIEAYTAARKRAKAGETLSKRDARLVSLLTYTEQPKKGGRLVVFTFKGGLILYDRRDHASGIFFEKDYDRLVQMLQADAKLVKYYSKYCFMSPKIGQVLSSSYEKLLHLSLEAMRKSNHDTCNKICRAFDVAQFLLLSKFANDINSLAESIQEAKIEKEKLRDVIDIDAAIEIMADTRLGIKECLELAKFNKIFPCPDFDIYSVVDSIKEKSENSHPSADVTVLVNDLGEDSIASKHEYANYQKRNRIINYYDVHGVLPGTLVGEESEDFPADLAAYPNMRPFALKLEHMAFIDIAATFNYVEFDGNEAAMVKDKTIAPTCPADSQLAVKDFSKIERNQVLKYIFSENFLPQRMIHKLAESGELFVVYKTWILLALKAEAKKPGSRAFSMATDEMRRLLSEAEYNVAQYVRSQRGSTQGKSEMSLDERLNEIAATPDLGKPYWEIILSADLDGFSPKQNISFKQEAMRSWSEVFDSRAFDATMKIFTETFLHFEKFDVADSFKMVGNDLEGFHGRMNTSAHLDLMGYAVYKMKEMDLVTGSAAMEALIDDGIMRIKLIKGRGTLAETVDQVIRTISDVYAFAGQKISWDKTFVSQILCMYLNRVFYDGVEVTPGAKAFMRIGKKLEVAIPTLSDEVAAHASTTRGAIQSGSDHLLAYYEMMCEVYKSYARWGLKSFEGSDSSRLAFASFIPIGLGGFGVPSLFQVSTNEAFGAMQSGIANMKMICHGYKGFAPMANTYLNAGVRDMSAETILRNPTTMRTKLRCLNLQRFANAAKAVVLKKSTNTLIMAVNRGDFDSADDAKLATVTATADLSEIQRSRLWAMSITSHVDNVVAKLQNSATAATIVGKKKAIGIFLANRSEARMILNETAKGRLVYRA